MGVHRFVASVKHTSLMEGQLRLEILRPNPKGNICKPELCRVLGVGFL